MKVLVACEFSGTVRDAFIAAGHDAMSCDLLPTEKPGPHHEGDVLPLLADPWDLVICHPPCVRLANSGVRWLHERNLWGELYEAVEFYKKFQQANSPRICIENPIMHKYARAMIGSPGKRQVVQPWWFGDKTFKATGYELKGLPELVATDKMTPPKPGTPEHREWSWIHMASPGPNRWKVRSRTPRGIAHAMASQWSF